MELPNRLTRLPLNPVTNSQTGQIKAAAYDPVQQVLQVQFANGRVYQLEHVDAKLHKAFNEAPSAGHFYHSVLKNGRQIVEVKDDAAE